MNVTKITAARLYNLGSYEHVRYEITVDVKDGEAANTMRGLEKILEALKPIDRLPICSEHEIQRKQREVEEMKKMPMAEWERRYGHCAGTPSEVMQRYQTELDESIARREAAVRRAKQARALLDDLGGAAEWKDAKLNWEYED